MRFALPRVLAELLALLSQLGRAHLRAPVLVPAHRPLPRGRVVTR
ncbi:MAG TPA: hypothetical protein VEM76_07590 [Anaeromyxobacteraceae bacterium]|nr:hypothetical protein [Anaeromyxobacteraceae bacterium]